MAKICALALSRFLAIFSRFILYQNHFTLVKNTLKNVKLTALFYLVARCCDRTPHAITTDYDSLAEGHADTGPSDCFIGVFSDKTVLLTDQRAPRRRCRRDQQTSRVLRSGAAPPRCVRCSAKKPTWWQTRHTLFLHAKVCSIAALRSITATITHMCCCHGFGLYPDRRDWLSAARLLALGWMRLRSLKKGVRVTIVHAPGSRLAGLATNP